MKDHQFAHAGFFRHQPSLSGCQVVALPGLICVLIYRGGLTVEDVGASCKLDDPGFVHFVVPGIDDIRDLLPPADGDESLAHVSQ